MLLFCGRQNLPTTTLSYLTLSRKAYQSAFTILFLILSVLIPEPRSKHERGQGTAYLRQGFKLEHAVQKGDKGMQALNTFEKHSQK